VNCRYVTSCTTKSTTNLQQTKNCTTNPQHLDMSRRCTTNCRLQHVRNISQNGL